MKLIFALNEARFFEKKHFGEAENFAIYVFKNANTAAQIMGYHQSKRKEN